MTDLQAWLEKYAEHVWTNETLNGAQIIVATFPRCKLDDSLYIAPTIVSIEIKVSGEVLAFYRADEGKVTSIPANDMQGVLAWLQEDWGEEEPC